VPPHYDHRGNVQIAVFQHTPLMVLALGLGRYFSARAEMFKSADGAALAVVQEVDVPTFLDTGQTILLPSTYSRAQEYAADNSDYLTGHKICPRVAATRVNQTENTVYVSLEADASSHFPAQLDNTQSCNLHYVNGALEIVACDIQIQPLTNLIRVYS
jgi:hypothetical protein